MYQYPSQAGVWKSKNRVECTLNFVPSFPRKRQTFRPNYDLMRHAKSFRVRWRWSHEDKPPARSIEIGIGQVQPRLMDKGHLAIYRQRPCFNC